MKVALIQITSVLDPKVNLDKIDNFIELAKTHEPKLKGVFLPEVFYSMSDGTKPTPYLIEDNNEHYQNIQKISQKHQVYILGGTAATRVGDKIINRSYNSTSS